MKVVCQVWQAAFFWIRREIRLRSMIGHLANEAIIFWQVTYAAEKKPGQDFVPMVNLLLPATLQPTFRTDPFF